LVVHDLIRNNKFNTRGSGEGWGEKLIVPEDRWEGWGKINNCYNTFKNKSLEKYYLFLKKI
jgi:hypothetical protein